MWHKVYLVTPRSSRFPPSKYAETDKCRSGPRPSRSGRRGRRKGERAPGGGVACGGSRILHCTVYAVRSTGVCTYLEESRAQTATHTRARHRHRPLHTPRPLQYTVQYTYRSRGSCANASFGVDPACLIGSSERDAHPKGDRRNHDGNRKPVVSYMVRRRQFDRTATEASAQLEQKQAKRRLDTRRKVTCCIAGQGEICPRRSLLRLPLRANGLPNLQSYCSSTSSFRLPHTFTSLCAVRDTFSCVTANATD